MTGPIKSRETAHNARETRISSSSLAASLSGAKQPAPGIRAAGNQAVQKFALNSLSIASPRDPCERQANSVAEEILRAPDFRVADELPRLTRAAEGRNSDSARAVLPGGAVLHALGRSDGVPLPPDERRFFESRFASDFSAVRVFADHQAHSAAREIGARAFTHGSNIYFGAGHWVPGTSPGRRLLAHELTHTLQQSHSAPGLIQADFESDFAGRTEVRVIDVPTRPPGTIQMTNAAGQEVWAPYSIVSPNEVPPAYQEATMKSGSGFKWRHPNLDISEQLARETARGAEQGNLSVADMRRMGEGAGSGMNPRVMMAKVDGQYRFVGYDVSASQGGVVTEGFVESAKGTKIVGQKLFTDRVTRALRAGETGMHLKVYTEEVEAFHASVQKAAGITEAPPLAGRSYMLDTRQMANVALQWDEGLSGEERQLLRQLLSSKDVITPQEVQAILKRSGPKPGGGGKGGGESEGKGGSKVTEAAETTEGKPKLSTEKPSLTEGEGESALKGGKMGLGKKAFLAYGVYSTGKNLYKAAQTGDWNYFGLVAAEEGAAWASTMVMGPLGPIAVHLAIAYAELFGQAIAMAPQLLAAVVNEIAEVGAEARSQIDATVFRLNFIERESLDPDNWDLHDTSNGATLEQADRLGQAIWARVGKLQLQEFRIAVRQPLRDLGVSPDLARSFAQRLSIETKSPLTGEELLAMSPLKVMELMKNAKVLRFLQDPEYLSYLDLQPTGPPPDEIYLKSKVQPLAEFRASMNPYNWVLTPTPVHNDMDLAVIRGLGFALWPQMEHLTFDELRKMSHESISAFNLSKELVRRAGWALANISNRLFETTPELAAAFETMLLQMTPEDLITFLKQWADLGFKTDPALKAKETVEEVKAGYPAW